MINRFNTISWRIFDNFTWPDGLPDFSKYNLIYGWNGSGKSTLSKLFQQIELGMIDSDAAFNVQVGNSSYRAQDIPQNFKDKIKVFNAAYVDNNIFKSGDENIDPIFFLGADSVEKQKRIKILTSQKNKQNFTIERYLTESVRRNADFETFCADSARYIKEIANFKSTYDKRNYKERSNQLKKIDRSSFFISSKEKEDLKTIIHEDYKDTIDQIEIERIGYDSILKSADDLLSTKIISKAISSYKENPELNTWARKGLEIHKKKGISTCLFCGQDLTDERLSKLESHFSNQYSNLIRELESLITKVATSLNSLTINFPSEARFYKNLAPAYIEIRKKIETWILDRKQNLSTLHNLLIDKKKNPFKTLTFAPAPATESIPPLLKTINRVIEAHNERATAFSQKVEDAQNTLVDAVVSEAMGDYAVKQMLIKDSSDRLTKAEALRDDLANEIVSLNNSIRKHHQAAEKINKDLVGYLGHNSIRFESHENGYRINRNKMIAKDLSEGEKTAIAFTYFLQTLSKDNIDYDLKNGIVVIDDPISSLDSNAIYHAFGLMKQRIADAKQIFILTHNFPFFRNVRKWFKFVGKKQSSQYMLKIACAGDKRHTSIAPINSFLIKFNSEYHYLFFLVHKFSQTEDPSPEDCFGMPNVARRLLESFFAFHYPSKDHFGLHQLIEDVDFDGVKKGKISNFLNTYSHSHFIHDDSDHDTSILSETKNALEHVFELMNVVNPHHCAEMITVINSTDT